MGTAKGFKRLDRIGMSPLRMFFLVTAMPIAISTLLIALGWIAFDSVKSGEPTLSTVPTKAWGVLAIGIVAVAAVAWLSRGAGTFGRVLQTRAAEIATIKMIRRRAAGVGLGRMTGHILLLASNERPLAQMLVNDVSKFPELKVILAEAAPAAAIVETEETMSAHVHI